MRIELDGHAFRDALEELSEVGKALRHRHGERFRDLDRRIEAFVDADPQPSVEHIGDGRLTILPPPELTAILRDARALGLLAAKP